MCVLQSNKRHIYIYIHVFLYYVVNSTKGCHVQRLKSAVMQYKFNTTEYDIDIGKCEIMWEYDMISIDKLQR